MHMPDVCCAKATQPTTMDECKPMFSEFPPTHDLSWFQWVMSRTLASTVSLDVLRNKSLRRGPFSPKGRAAGLLKSGDRAFVPSQVSP